MEDFATTMLDDLHRYLTGRGAVDERLPESPDVEAKWPPVAEAYLPDGVREFANYPIASLGWMMFIGMAIAKRWDEDWETYGKIDDLYTPMRDKRGFDNLDEYILDEVLDLHGDAADDLQMLVGDCAERVKRAIFRLDIEPGTVEAFKAYVAGLQCLVSDGHGRPTQGDGLPHDQALTPGNSNHSYHRHLKNLQLKKYEKSPID